MLGLNILILFKLVVALPLIWLFAHALQLLLLYVAGGLAGSLAHVTQYYLQAQSTGNMFKLMPGASAYCTTVPVACKPCPSTA